MQETQSQPPPRKRVTFKIDTSETKEESFVAKRRRMVDNIAISLPGTPDIELSSDSPPFALPTRSSDTNFDSSVEDTTLPSTISTPCKLRIKRPRPVTARPITPPLMPPPPPPPAVGVQLPQSEEIDNQVQYFHDDELELGESLQSFVNLDTLGISEQQAELLDSLMERDLTPEDYELLLALDKNIHRPTLTQADVESISSVHVHGLSDDEESEPAHNQSALCSVCQEHFAEGDRIRRLNACSHFFHRECIDDWLESSTICPLDGLSLLKSD